jgi:crotonobetainyl-CoA:carnitine CoA-transferase CaiB-like acyl-CoA transferase
VSLTKQSNPVRNPSSPHALGVVREPAGSAIPTAAPSNAYPIADGKWILIAANSDPLFARLATLIGQPELAHDPRFAGNRMRVRNSAILDGIIAAQGRRIKWVHGM